MLLLRSGSLTASAASAVPAASAPVRLRTDPYTSSLIAGKFGSLPRVSGGWRQCCHRRLNPHIPTDTHSINHAASQSNASNQARYNSRMTPNDSEPMSRPRSMANRSCIPTRDKCIAARRLPTGYRRNACLQDRMSALPTNRFYCSMDTNAGDQTHISNRSRGTCWNSDSWDSNNIPRSSCRSQRKPH